MKTPLTFLLLVLLPALGAAEKFTVTTIEPLYRAHRFATQPELNPETRFTIGEIEIPGLWETLGVQAFAARDLVRDQSIPRNPFLSYRGKIHPFVESFGGPGLMSAVMADQALYYTYAYGSGIHRSHVGRLQIVNDTLQFTESAALVGKDLFVEKAPDGRIRIVIGAWRGFNRWETEVGFGWIDWHDKTRLSIVDDAGRAGPLDRK